MIQKVIGAVIATLNRGDYLCSCLKAFETQTMPADCFEVVIVDNGSTDDTRAIAREFCGRNPHFSYVREERRGLATARNSGIARCAAGIVAFTDDDAVPEPDWLERLMKRFAELPDEVAVVGGEIQPVWEGQRPEWLTNAMLRPLSAGLMWTLSARDLKAGEWLVEANSAYRKRWLLQFGGFPEHLGRVGDMLLSGENCVNRLMQRAGLRMFFDPSILVRHRIPASRLTRTWFRRRMFWQGVTMNLLNRYVEEQSAVLGLNCGEASTIWEEVLIPSSPAAWIDLFDDNSSSPFQEQLDTIEKIGYLLESQAVVVGR
jgi:glycosyltransferase involved in cell wall biosynthesis